MSDLDKDIEIVKSIIVNEKFNLELEEKYCVDIIDSFKVKGIKNRISALENVLSELENRKEKLDDLKESNRAMFNEQVYLKAELETYKKMCEKLGELLIGCSIDGDVSWIDDVENKEQAIDWARKEVENENNI